MVKFELSEPCIGPMINTARTCYSICHIGFVRLTGSAGLQVDIALLDRRSKTYRQCDLCLHLSNSDGFLYFNIKLLFVNYTADRKATAVCSAVLTRITTTNLIFFLQRTMASVSYLVLMDQVKVKS